MTEIIVGVLCFATGVVYPSYMSFKAVKSTSKDDDTQWLSYWVIYSLVEVLQYILGFILAWVPFFTTFKLIGLLYLVHPGFKGAELIFRKADPYLKKYVDIVDGTMEKVVKSISAAPPKSVEGVNKAS